jgi:YD repeat-containing protein
LLHRIPIPSPITHTELLHAAGVLQSFLSKVTQKTVSRNNVTQLTQYYDYDQAGNLVGIRGNNGQHTTNVYDSSDRLFSTTDALGNQTQYGYNFFSHVVSITDPSGHTATSSYETGGKLSSVTDYRGLVTTYTYDGLGNLISTQSPDTGLTTYSYNAAGQVVQKQDANGVVTNFSYDGLGRLHIRSSGSSFEYFNYDSCANGVGKLCSLIDTSGSTLYAYESDGRLIKQTVTVNGSGLLAQSATYVTQWTYDSTGQVATVTYPDGNQVSYAYDGAAHVSSVVVQPNNGSARTFASNFTYTALGALSSVSLADGNVRRRTYDQDGRLIATNTGTVQSLSYSYDSADHIVSIVNGVKSADSETYSYDSNSRLTGLMSTSGDKAWTFDADSNRLTENDAGVIHGYSPSYYNNQNTSTSGIGSFTYDATGNLISRKGNNSINGGLRNLAITYDNFERVASITGVKNVDSLVNVTTAGSYAYNALGCRLWVK